MELGEFKLGFELLPDRGSQRYSARADHRRTLKFRKAFVERQAEIVDIIQKNVAEMISTNLLPASRSPDSLWAVVIADGDVIVYGKENHARVAAKNMIDSALALSVTGNICTHTALSKNE